MMGAVKQIIGCLVLATFVAVACYFLPIVNGLFGDYLMGFFLGALVLPIGLKWYEGHMVKVRAMSQPVRKTREKECKDWHEEDREAMTCVPHCYDARNVDQQLHIFDEFKG